jgi:hypothetical protein
VEVTPGVEVHDGIGAPADGPDHFIEFATGRRDRRVADVGVDLYAERPPDDHRLALGMAVVGRDDRTAGGYLVAHQLRPHPLTGGDEGHLRGDEAVAGPL